jgi:hypothetical protein
MSNTAPINGTRPVCTRHPTANPTANISATTNTFRTRSASVRPARTAERAMGSDRNRSINPWLRSVASPIAVFSAPNVTVCTKIPGIRKSTYGTPGTWIAPPKTYRNSRTNSTGWMIEKTSRSGTRMICLINRVVMTHESPKMVPRRAAYWRAAA